jgi:uncharacterized protein YhbP (UPF0306 family)
MLYSQLQRHTAIHCLSTKIKQSPFHLKKVVALIGAVDFQDRLSEAEKDPNGEAANQMYRVFSPHIIQVGQHLPFTKASQKSSLSRMISLIRHFGNTQL